LSDLKHFNATTKIILNAQVTSNVQYISQHTLLCVSSGLMTIDDGSKKYNLQSGDHYLITRNSLAKFFKNPLLAEEFVIVEIQLDSHFLKAFSNEYQYIAHKHFNEGSIISLKSDEILQRYLDSRNLYESLRGEERDNLLILKNKELVLLLLNLNPELQHVLFNFDEPQKADLEDYMNRNYKYNLSLSQFGYLSGRSLTSFKRDFEKIFNKAPGRWLLEKRLNEARILIENQGKKPNDVYLEVGFEDLSHFSFAFKKAFGASPKKIIKSVEKQ
jgi:AraC-like DNA-binding protein